LDGGQEVSRGLFVAGGDRTQLLDLGGEVPDQVARVIKLSVIVAQRGPVGPRRDHGGSAGGGQRLQDADIGVERLVGDQRIASKVGKEVVCSYQV
jgi:hypothetical protein